METFNQGLLDFLGHSPTPFHAAKNITETLISAGFERLHESDCWQLQPGKRYVVTRNDSSVLAFVYGTADLDAQGIRMIGAHTDSPCLKVKPAPETNRKGYAQLGVETYGGVLQSTWFDRDLSLAGRVTYRDHEGHLRNQLLDFETAIAVVPSLAIHLDREANSNKSINAQNHLPPVLFLGDEKQAWDFRELLKQRLEQQGASCDRVLDYELSFYDVQKPAVTGLRQEFISSARLDNLLSCYVGMQAMLQAGTEHSVLLICNDHEEVGSASACGAQGPMLEDFLVRLQPEPQARLRCINQSLMISADNAHAIHPNFSDKHDQNHGPKINQGPVIKINANQRYATNSETAGAFRHWCEQVGVPVQAFVTRTDLGCGSTIGPITATEVGVRTIDIGVPTFAMHSIREMAGTEDAYSLCKVLSYYVNNALVQSDSAI
ncbi:MAG: M18 family aminopeptidase [Candidatus Pelagadaptatus aseana]|uniref:M18 family aminopeptidase n=1 Tax=Candidatus Pelagadaptatus aseana TaxID=3120508 RepID=UPI0039B23DB8